MIEQTTVICIKNGDYVDLLVGKSYNLIPDLKAKSVGYLRVVDESGEDYLYPESFFEKIRNDYHLSVRHL